MTGDTIRIHLQWLDGRTLDLDWSGDEAQANPTTIQNDRREFTATGDRTDRGLPIYQERDDS